MTTYQKYYAVGWFRWRPLWRLQCASLSVHTSKQSINQPSTSRLPPAKPHSSGKRLIDWKPGYN